MKTVKMFLLFIIFVSGSFAQTSLTKGTEAPDFTLPDASGNEFTLSSYEGQSPVVIYFYPAAGTSGCTKQACAIRDDWNKFEENNIQVFGISTDNKEAIKKFVDDYSLNFPLLSDEDKKVTEQYGVLKDNGTAKRVTFIVDKDGKIADILEVKEIDKHADYVFNSAIKLNSKHN
ncbi:MAG TPA: peroxiredoxin [Ignavibacteriaceae bacterium]|nr:peroxiredoxin [Ignavibacteriaceae bacterium]